MFHRVSGPGSGRAYLLLQELLLLVDSGEQRVQRVQVGGTLQLVVQVVLHADIHVVLSSSPVLSFSSYSSGWPSMSVYRPRMDQATEADLFEHLVVVQGVCDLIGFPSETRRTDYLPRRVTYWPSVVLTAKVTSAAVRAPSPLPTTTSATSIEASFA